jgi:cytochrome c oxidase subunit 2
MNRISIALAVVAIGLLAGCGGDDDASAADLPPAALEGRAVFRSNGCSACHGSNGNGGVGPSFVGLYGSEVQLQGGETVIADRDYLTRSIVDPSAQLVDGFNLPMPRKELTDDEIDAVLEFIRALAEETP